MGRGLAVAAARVRRGARALGAAPIAPALLTAARGPALRLAALALATFVTFVAFLVSMGVRVAVGAAAASVVVRAVLAPVAVPAAAPVGAVTVPVVVRAGTVGETGRPVRRRVLRIRLRPGRGGRIRA